MSQKNTVIIAVVNHKRGYEKTIIVINLSSELAKIGLTVLVIDLDPQTNASLYVGKKHPSEVAVTYAELLLSEVENYP